MAWETYVRGNVVSKHAARLIKSFLLNTQVGGCEGDVDENDEGIPQPEKDVEMPPLNLTCNDFKNLLACEDDVHDEKEGTLAEKLLQDAKKLSKENRNAHGYLQSKVLGRSLWSTDIPQDSAADRVCELIDYDETYTQHLQALTKKTTQTTDCGPSAMKVDAHAVYAPSAPSNIAKVLADILQGAGNPAVVPNARQKTFLQHFVARLCAEAASPEVCLTEPLLDCVHGPPGTGSI